METMRIQLQRVGVSRISEGTIPLIARCVTATGYGLNLLAKDRFTDVATAMATIQARLDQKFGQAVPIRWIDCTRVRYPDDEECGGLMETE